MTTADRTPVLLDGTRSPFGKYLKGLNSLSARELGAHTLSALLERHNYIRTADGILLAQVVQSGQGQNPARQIAASAGMDPAVPALTLNNVCLGGITAVADAARRIRTEEGKIYIAGGVDSMSRAPHAGYLRDGAPVSEVDFVDTLSSDGLWCALENEPMGVISERANVELGIDREVQDKIAARSHELAAQARDGGRFAEEISPLQVNGTTVCDDEGIRKSSLDALGKLRPTFAEDGTITAGNASQMTDGASIGAVTSEAVAESFGITPLARILGYAEVAGPDASLHLKPAVAIERVLERTGVALADISLIEINEAFAGVVEASRRQLSVSIDPINVQGGAIALGHPLGGSGFRLLLTLARELAHRGGRYGVASMCGGGGQGAAVLMESIN